MKFKKIQTKMLVGILPVIIIAMLVLTLVSEQSSKKIINSQISKQMTSELVAQKTAIENDLNSIMTTAKGLSLTVGSTNKVVQLPEYEKLLGTIVQSNKLILGAGIWFEPNVYKADQKYVGPYVYKDGNELKTTYDYSNAEYDYFSQEYYKIAKNSKDAVITAPYFDQTSGLFMSTCTMPITDENGTFIGCVTVDIEISAIQDMVNSVKVGEKGTEFLIGENGVYLGTSDRSKVEKGVLITADSNTSLAKAGETIIKNEKGVSVYDGTDGTYNLYYNTIKGVNWKIIIQIPQAEINAPVKSLMFKLIMICLIALVITSMILILSVSYISKSIKKVQKFVNSLAQGDFCIDMLNVKSKEEIGQMSQSLNLMYENNKTVISEITNHAKDIDVSSESLYDSATQLKNQFKKIEEYMGKVSEAMMSSSAATEEVNASSEEVDSYITVLAQETDTSKQKTVEIGSRANQVKNKSKEAYDYATQLSEKYEQDLSNSIENVKVVERIVEMADVISNIAEEINLLSLNASIEAARAGEQGKGFAVVAAEIGKLANETSKAVDRIQDTIAQVNSAVEGLTGGSKSLLGFVQTTVTPDYNSFVTVAEQYGQDAEVMTENAEKISEMAENIKRIMNEVSSAIENIAESSQTTAQSSGNTMKAVSEVSYVVEEVSKMSNEHKEISDNLNHIVKQFKLD